MTRPNSSSRLGRVRSGRAGTSKGRSWRPAYEARWGVWSRLGLLVGVVVLLVSAGTALAFQFLPPGGQVNDDLAAGINKTISVSGEDPTNADVVGGALTAGTPAVPWAIFRQQEHVRYAATS